MINIPLVLICQVDQFNLNSGNYVRTSDVLTKVRDYMLYQYDLLTSHDYIISLNYNYPL